ncbi:hypothetical protein FJTKL_04927 [Diaporthe vaccinii]|uniref:Uncharacterized protein n=1 Tax=Diaporthe vaccinii TaxID=105482 RepID=A0ABR4DS47_9PEZI
MPADRSPTAQKCQVGYRRTSFSDQSSSDDEFPDILSEKFKELCQRRNQERIAMAAAEVLEALLDKKKAAEAMTATRPTKSAKPINMERARDEPRRSRRIQAASRSSRHKAVQGVRRSSRIAARTGRSS